MAFFVNPCCIFRDCGLNALHVATVGVVVATFGLEAVASACSLGVVVYLVSVVELVGVEFAYTCNWVCAIYAFDCTLLILVRVAPRNSLVPVEVRCHRVSFAVFLDFEIFVTTVCRVGKTLAYDAVANPEYKLLVLAVCNLGLVHPETVDTDSSCISLQVP